MFYPKVTVLITTYNYDKFIGDAIDSILKQDYEINKIEIIIIDDGSKDDTFIVVQEYIKINNNIIYRYQQNKGKAAATKLGIKIASGKYLFNLDADDFFYYNCISTIVKFYESDTSLVQVSHLANRIDGINNAITPQINTHDLVNVPVNGFSFFQLMVFNNYNIGLGSTFSARVSELKKIEINEDVDMYIDLYLFIMLSRFGNVMQLDKILSAFRRHEKSFSEGNTSSALKKQKVIRYSKSAKAVYFEIKNYYNSKKIILHYKYFYETHLLSTAFFIKVNEYSIVFSLFNYTISSFWKYKRPFVFLKNSFKQICIFYANKAFNFISYKK